MSTDSTFPAVLFKSEKEDWATPPDVFAALDKEFGFQLDACASEWNKKCATYYDKADNALLQPWHPFGSVFLNPPYGRGMGVWIAKARAEAVKGATVVILIPSRTDTRWFHDYIYEQAEVRYLQGRLKFERPDGPRDAATFPSMVVIMRPTDRTKKEEPKMTTAHFYTRLESNVKVPIDVELDSLNMFVGGNKQGKTAGIEAAILAQTGKLPGLVHGKDITGFVPKGDRKITARLSNGTISTEYSANAGKKLPSSPVQSDDLRELLDGCEHVIPSVSMRDLLNRNAAKTKEAIMRRFGKIKTIAVPKALDEEQQVMWIEAIASVADIPPEDDAKETIATAVKKRSAAEILADMQGWLDSTQRRANTAANAKENEVNAVQDISDDAAGAELIPQLERQRDEARLSEHQANNKAALAGAEVQLTELQPDAQRILAECTSAEEELTRVTGLRAEAEGRAAACKAEALDLFTRAEQSEEALRRAQDALDLMNRCVEAKATTCPFCAGSAGDWVGRQVTVGALVQTRTQERDMAQRGAESKRAEVQRIIDSAELQAQEIQERHESAQVKRQKLKARAQELKSQIAVLREAVGSVADYGGPSVADLQLQIGRYRAAEGQRMNVERMEDDIRTLRRRADIAKTLKTEAKKALAAALRKTKKAAEKAVNTHMPEGFTAALDISDTVCEWRVVGEDGRGHNRHTMCGSEKATIVIALALAWTEDAPMRILTLDDQDLAMLEPDNLIAMLKRVEALQQQGKITQVFSAWPAARLDHVSDIPASWNIIKVGD